jgi:uncharacterized protein (DUF1778 family)
MTGSDFVRDAASRAAEEVVVERTFVCMSPLGFGAFIAAIEAPAAAVPQLVELFKRRVPWAASAD